MKLRDRRNLTEIIIPRHNFPSMVSQCSVSSTVLAILEIFSL